MELQYLLLWWKHKQSSKHFWKPEDGYLLQDQEILSRIDEYSASYQAHKSKTQPKTETHPLLESISFWRRWWKKGNFGVSLWSQKPAIRDSNIYFTVLSFSWVFEMISFLKNTNAKIYRKDKDQKPNFHPHYIPENWLSTHTTRNQQYGAYPLDRVIHIEIFIVCLNTYWQSFRTVYNLMFSHLTPIYVNHRLWHMGIIQIPWHNTQCSFHNILVQTSKQKSSHEPII